MNLKADDVISVPDHPSFDPRIITQKTLKIDNFRFKPEVRGWTSKLMTSSDSMCWIIPFSTVKLLRIS